MNDDTMQHLYVQANVLNSPMILNYYYFWIKTMILTLNCILLNTFFFTSFKVDHIKVHELQIYVILLNVQYYVTYFQNSKKLGYPILNHPLFLKHSNTWITKKKKGVVKFICSLIIIIIKTSF